MLKDVASKKMATPAGKRETVAHLRSFFEVSERRACAVLGVDRTSVRSPHPWMSREAQVSRSPDSGEQNCMLNDTQNRTLLTQRRSDRSLDLEFSPYFLCSTAAADEPCPGQVEAIRLASASSKTLFAFTSAVTTARSLS